MRVAVLGAGTWGIALAKVLCNNEHSVAVWSALSAEIDQLAKDRRQPNLPDFVIPTQIKYEKDISIACEDKDIIVFAVPSIYVRDTAKQALPYINKDTVIVSVSKGIEAGTLMTMTEIIEDEATKAGKEIKRVVALSGPTHAEEVARDLPTAIVAASNSQEAAEVVQDAFGNPNFRVYTNPDIKGVEISGAIKNVIALAVGISTGLGFQDNARAALITRGMEEIRRLGIAMGCNELTFSGLAGIGDLIVTASSQHSRNNRCGQLIGKGIAPAEAVREVGMVVEGLNALPTVLELADRYSVETPIAAAVAEIVIKGMDPKAVSHNLMERESKPENERMKW